VLPARWFDPFDVRRWRCGLFLLVVVLLASSCGRDGEDTEIEAGGEVAEPAEVLEGFYVVQPDDTLREVVQEVCGESTPELVLNVLEANRSNQQEDGEYLTDVDEIGTGWILQVPCVLPLPALIECPATADLLFSGQGDGARVLLCRTDGKTEYFGQRLSDRASITLDACVRSDDLVEASNPGPTVDTFYLVDTRAGYVEVRQDEKGVDPLDAEVLVRFDFDERSDGGLDEIRLCGTSEPPPVEERNIVYPADPAPLSTVAFDASWSIPENRPSPNCLGSSSQPALSSPSFPATPGVDPTRWLQHPQGQILRLSALPEQAKVRVSGGGHEWVMNQSFSADRYELDITDDRPLGRYIVTVDGRADPVAKVEIIRQNKFLLIRDEAGTGGGQYRFRLYGGPVELSIRVRQQSGCDLVWHPLQTIGAPRVNGSGVAKLEIDFRGSPDRAFCVAVDDECVRTFFPRR